MKRLIAIASLILRTFGAGVLVCIVCWSLVESAPGQTAERAARATGAILVSDAALSDAERADIVRDVATRLNLRESSLAQIVFRGAGATVFDYGLSWRDGEPVRSKIASSAGLTTFVLCLAALLLAVGVACLAAPRAARENGSWPSELAAALAALALCIPVPWLAMLALDTLAYGHPLSVAPKGGLTSAVHGILPILVLAVVPAAVLWSHLRRELEDASQAPWVVAIRARGVLETRIWNRHLLKFAIPTVLALLPVLFAYLFAASVVVEYVFAIDGLGALIARSAQLGDVPVLVGSASLSAMSIHALTLLVNIAIGRLDPRRSQS